MGITISHAIGMQNDRVEKTLDRTQAIAEQIKKEQAPKLGISFEIHRLSPHRLLINIGQCETLSFTFDYFEKYLEVAGWNYECATLGRYFSREELQTADNPHLKNWPNQRKMWSSSFCKTQFSDSVVEHKWVAELIRTVASVADFAHVHDEGDYYHTLNVDDASESIASLGAMIDELGKTFANMGVQTVRGGETKVKARKRRTL